MNKDIIILKIYLVHSMNTYQILLHNEIPKGLSRIFLYRVFRFQKSSKEEGGKISYPKIVEMASEMLLCCLYSGWKVYGLKSASALERVFFMRLESFVLVNGDIGTSFLPRSVLN